MFGKKKLYFVLDNTGKTLYTVTDSKKIAIDIMKSYSNPYTTIYCVEVKGKAIRGK